MSSDTTETVATQSAFITIAISAHVGGLGQPRFVRFLYQQARAQSRVMIRHTHALVSQQQFARARVTYRYTFYLIRRQRQY